MTGQKEKKEKEKKKGGGGEEGEEGKLLWTRGRTTSKALQEVLLDLKKPYITVTIEVCWMVLLGKLR